MNQPLLLHVVERLESFIGRLPATIQKPILNELTPLKQLFLQQRPPRFLFTGPSKTTIGQIVAALFPGFVNLESPERSTETRLWQEFSLPDRGTISVLDARDIGTHLAEDIRTELERLPADFLFFVADAEQRKIRKGSLENAVTVLGWNDRKRSGTEVIGIVLSQTAGETSQARELKNEASERAATLKTLLESSLESNQGLAGGFAVGGQEEAQAVISLIAPRLPNEARLEMARISGNRASQAEIAQLLVKSTTAICTAIGAQPIPLADLPILTTLQLVMVSGIMYVSGRERSLRAATEFIAALGVNVGAGMLFRQGARAILKFFPGWGNLVSGMVAGAGTYAIGRAAIAYFLEGASLSDARRTYLTSRRKSPRPALLDRKHEKSEPATPSRGRRKRARLRR